MATFSVFDRVTAKIKGKTFKSFYLHLNCDWHHLKLFMNCVRWYHKIWIFWLPWKQFPFYLIPMCQSLYWWWSRQRPALSGCFSSFITCCFTLVKGMWVFSSLSFFFLYILDDLIIIVVIIMWPSKKLHKKYNSNITVIRACDSFKWVMFMQNYELDVTVFNKSKDIFSVLLFSVCCFQ